MDKRRSAAGRRTGTIVLATAVASMLAACAERSGGSGAVAVAPPALRPGVSAQTMALLHHRGFNGFVVPLLEEGEPTRWADPHNPVICGEDCAVKVNGEELQPGAEVPAGAFTLQWQAQLYSPFGAEGPTFDGRVEVLVFRDDEHGMEAIVRPVQLGVSDSSGSTTLMNADGAFVSSQWRFADSPSVRGS